MNVVFATDASEQAERAQRLIAAIAWPAPTHIEVLYVDQLFGGDLDLPAGRYTSLHERIRDEIDAHLARVKLALAGPGRDVETTLLLGRPADVIVEEARRTAADLIVVGSHGRGGLASALLGSVSAEVVDRAPGPVLVARSATLSRAVLASDGSDGARQAEEIVAAWPFLAALPVRVVSVASLAPLITAPPSLGAGAVPAETYQQLIDDLRALHEGAANDSVTRLTARGITASAAVPEGYAPAEIIREASQSGADIIVIGSRGRTGLARLVLGSVARSVLFGAPCSVLIVRQRAGA